jgi:3-dehydrosphinganine reductase
LCNDLTIDEYRWMMDLNLHGTVNTVKAFLPGMLQRKSGHIVNISSIAGFLGVYSYTAYSASKFAVKGFTDALRVELTTDQTGVDLSIVFPPDTEGESLEKERAYKPAILAAADEGTPSMTGDAVARAILEGVAKKHYIITPGLWSNLYFKLVGLTGGGLLYTVLDLIFADARNKVRRNQAKYQYHPKG